MFYKINKTTDWNAMFKYFAASHNMKLYEFTKDYSSRNPAGKTTVNNLCNKLNRKSLKLKEMVDMLDAYGYELAVVPKDDTVRTEDITTEDDVKSTDKVLRITDRSITISQGDRNVSVDITGCGDVDVKMLDGVLCIK